MISGAGSGIGVETVRENAGIRIVSRPSGSGSGSGAGSGAPRSNGAWEEGIDATSARASGFSDRRSPSEASRNSKIASAMCWRDS